MLYQEEEKLVLVTASQIRMQKNFIKFANE
jgi:hypothetical protein